MFIVHRSSFIVMKRLWPILRDYTLMTVGALLAAISVDVFLLPNNVVSGGVTGAAMLLNSSFHTPVGLVTLLVNIPLFVLGFWRLGGLVFGLRTLARSDPKYIARYHGPQTQRDAAYHNGAIWPWLIGGFLEAYLKVNGRSTQAIEQARQWLRPLVDHMDDLGCIGQVAEIFEADQPHRPVGCPAQAWSVAEVLRMAVELGM